jgi:phospholipase/carboxylesterase
VQAAINTELIEFNGWALRVRASQSRSPRLLVLIHGWTGDENSMWIFTRGLSPDYWMIAPRAPHPAEPSGFSWRPPDSLTFGKPSLETLIPAVEALMRLIDEYSASVKLDALQFDLMGFSQGAAVVNLIGMLFPHRVRKMGVLAGFVPAGLEELILKKPLTGKNIFVAHGTADQLVPIDRARASIELLEQAGAHVTYCEDDVGHKLSASCLRALEDYLASRDEG